MFKIIAAALFIACSVWVIYKIFYFLGKIFNFINMLFGAGAGYSSDNKK